MNPYVLSLLNPGCKWGRKHGSENNKKKDSWAWPVNGTLGTRDGKGVYRGIAAVGGTVSPTLDPSERKAVIPELSELPFLFTINPGPWGKWERGLVTGVSLDSEKINFCIHPLFPKPPFCAPVWWLMDQHFPSKREGHPSQLPWQCRPLPVN